MTLTLWRQQANVVGVDLHRGIFSGEHRDALNSETLTF